MKPYNESGFRVHSERLGLHIHKSPYIPLYKRGTKGDSHLWKGKTIGRYGCGDFIKGENGIASEVNNKGILAMTPEFRHCEPEGRGNLILTESENHQRSGNVICPELVLKDLYVSENNTGILCGGESKPVIKENKIINNIEYGVYITDDAQPNLGGKGNNHIYGSGLYDLYNNTDNKIMAKKNYWGTMLVAGDFTSTKKLILIK